MPSRHNHPHDDLEQELRGRLDVLSSETYSDPARHDLRRSDFAILLVVNLALVLLMYWIAWR